MDEGYSFFCGSVPILLLLWRHGGGPGPGPLLLLVAGCLGGLGAYMAFGQHFSAAGAPGTIFLIAAAGGSLVGQAANVVLGMMGSRAQTGAGV